jgi:hypothetical protein
MRLSKSRNLYLLVHIITLKRLNLNFYWGNLSKHIEIMINLIFSKAEGVNYLSDVEHLALASPGPTSYKPKVKFTHGL